MSNFVTPLVKMKFCKTKTQLKMKVYFMTLLRFFVLFKKFFPIHWFGVNDRYKTWYSLYSLYIIIWSFNIKILWKLFPNRKVGTKMRFCPLDYLVLYKWKKSILENIILHFSSHFPSFYHLRIPSWLRIFPLGPLFQLFHK